MQRLRNTRRSTGQQPEATGRIGPSVSCPARPRSAPPPCRVESRSRSSDRSSSWKTGLKMDSQQTWRKLVGEGNSKKKKVGSSSFFEPRGWKMGGDFFEDGGRILRKCGGVLRSSGFENPSSKEDSPYLRSDLRTILRGRRSKMASFFEPRRWKMGGTSSKVGGPSSKKIGLLRRWCDFFKDGSSESEDRRNPHLRRSRIPSSKKFPPSSTLRAKIGSKIVKDPVVAPPCAAE